MIRNKKTPPTTAALYLLAQIQNANIYVIIMSRNTQKKKIRDNIDELNINSIYVDGYILNEQEKSTQTRER